MSEFNQPPPPEPRPYLPIPLSNPFVTYIILGAIVVVWAFTEFVAGGSTNSEVLIQYGANYGPGILNGETWRLFTSMFLHIGLMHLGFNAYALYIFGLEMERIYGPDRYLVTYILTGLFGSLASFAFRGASVLSAGASGAIFGIIGMSLAFFYLHRDDFGQLGRARVSNLLFIIGLNLFIGFTIPGIDNMAHLGGLAAGAVLGYTLAPRYRLLDQYTTSPRVIDTVSLLNRWWVPLFAITVLASGISFFTFLYG